MKKQLSVIVPALLCMGGLALILVACAPTNQAGSKKKVEASAADTEFYKMDIKPLAPEECGRCHNYQFKWLQDKGGKHQMDCTTCHEQFHAYNPRKDNWDTIMPKCQGCHELAHGPDFPACMECHQQPHAPKVIQFANLEKTVTTEGKQAKVVCGVCHNNEGTEFDKFPSKHNTEVNCQGCHAEVHGTIPSCLDCHQPHIENQVYQDCLQCHAPHSASNIKKYPEDVPNAACSACHDSVYNNLRANVTKHSPLQCATCHASHGEIPRCQDCHGEPHGEGLHQRFTSCLDCHVDPHNLPVNEKK